MAKKKKKKKVRELEEFMDDERPNLSMKYLENKATHKELQRLNVYVVELMKDKVKDMAKKVRAKIKKGSKVKFHSQGGTDKVEDGIVGVVVSIKTKYANVDFDGKIWKVSMHWLKPVKEKKS